MGRAAGSKDTSKRKRRPMTEAERSKRTKTKAAAAAEAAASAKEAASAARRRFFNGPSSSAASGGQSAEEDFEHFSESVGQEDNDEEEDEEEEKEDEEDEEDEEDDAPEDEDDGGRSAHRPADVEAELDDDAQLDDAEDKASAMGVYRAAVHRRLQSEVCGAASRNALEEKWLLALLNAPSADYCRPARCTPHTYAETARGGRPLVGCRGLFLASGVLPLHRSPPAAVATTSSARQRVRSCRNSSNSAPNRPSPSPPDTCSQHPPGLTGALMPLKSGANGRGSMAYLPGLAADDASAATGLSTGSRSSPPRGAHAATARPTHAR
jgi:hypothetical protein